MKRRMVWVEQHPFVPRALRIFKSQKAAFASKVFVVQMFRDIATNDIRHALFLRSQGFCELCASVVTEKSGHMHERDPRGKGGEISLENSVFICARTHQLEHKDRAPRWSKKA